MKPALLLYCQHSVGIGHLMRSLLLASKLAQHFRVVLLNGGPIPTGLDVPRNVEIVDLPPLGTLDGHELVSRDANFDLDRAKSQRKHLVMQVYRRVAPAVLLIELFPFGRKKFAFELLPLLKAARRTPGTRPLVLCSLRDILVAARPDQQHHDDRAAWLCRRYFDAILVHSDPALARLEESFKPRRPAGIPVHYTGLVARERATAPSVRSSHLLVSAGGGLVGFPLLRAAIDAQRLLWPASGRRMRLIAGPFLPEPAWQALCEQAAGREDIDLVRSVPDLSAEMRVAAASLSQCGYNTAMDILCARVPALVVPYAQEREDEQRNRAGRLEAMGLLRVLQPDRLHDVELADALTHTLAFAPNESALALDGAQRCADAVARLAQSRPAARAAAEQAHGMA